MSSPQVPTPDVEELRRLAEKATKGPWTSEPYMELDYYAERGDFQVSGPDFKNDEAVMVGKADAEFIAAADPTTIRALLDERDALRERLDAVREGWGHLTASMNKGNEGAPAWFTVSVEDVAAFDSLLAPTSDKTKGGAGCH